MNLINMGYQAIFDGLNSKTMRRLATCLIPYRLFIIITIHLSIFLVSFLLSYWVVYGSLHPDEITSTILLSFCLLGLLRLITFFHYDLFQGMWRYASFEDLVNIARAVTISSIAFIIVGAFWDSVALTDRLYLLEWMICIFLCGGIRFSVRNIRENFINQKGEKDVENIILVGVLNRIQPVIKELTSDKQSNYNPVAIIDVGKLDHTGAMRINDIPVMTINEILRKKSLHDQIKYCVICSSGSDKRKLSQLIDTLSPILVPFRILPDFDAIVNHNSQLSEFRKIEIEDLLERQSIFTNLTKIGKKINDRGVLITGGGGSIGSELCRQVAEFQPRVIVAVERSEYNLYKLKRKMQREFPEINLVASVSTINYQVGLEMLMKRHAIDIVFHAAAYKHVPLMEEVPVECAYNNIVGTQNVATSAINAGVKRFVMISTDKAVNPTNVMGVTKRIAEMVVEDCNRKGKTRFITVRFGNVLDSAGSVIPIFKEQIENNRPLTVTHDEIERYFMTIPEAVQLVLQAGSMGEGGEVFVLNMGTPIRILHLAEKLITLSGKRPYIDVEINITGLRPGEKMYEELFCRDETPIETDHPSIKAAVFEPGNHGFIQKRLDRIKELVQADNAEGLLECFKETVPSFAPRTSAVHQTTNELKE